jgi:hypothetical protein
LKKAKLMAHALLLIATFHAALWLALAVLTALEPPHPERIQQPLAPRLGVVPDERVAEHDGESLRAAA